MVDTHLFELVSEVEDLVILIAVVTAKVLNNRVTVFQTVEVHSLLLLHAWLLLKHDVVVERIVVAVLELDHMFIAFISKGSYLSHELLFFVNLVLDDGTSVLDVDWLLFFTLENVATNLPLLILPDRLALTFGWALSKALCQDG